jgi:hypothetical protein
VAALGIEGVLAHAGDSKPLGAFYALALFGGVALYLAGQLLFKRRDHSVCADPTQPPRRIVPSQQLTR